jgi:hypothetical protein
MAQRAIDHRAAAIGRDDQVPCSAIMSVLNGYQAKPSFDDDFSLNAQTRFELRQFRPSRAMTASASLH